jgi:hypothetical protein
MHYISYKLLNLYPYNNSNQLSHLFDVTGILHAEL